MLLLFLASSAAPPPVHPGVKVTAASPATASVRIVRAAELRVDRMVAGEGKLLRKTQLRESDGSASAASLLEFY